MIGTTQMKAGRVHMQRQASNDCMLVPCMWGTTGFQSFWNVQQLPQTLIILIKLCDSLYKNIMFQEVSVEELRIYFNGKQSHSSVIWYFAFFLFWKHAFWIFNSFFVKASVTHVIAKMFVQWHAWEYSYLILMIKPCGQKIMSRNLLLFIKKKRG